MKIVYREATPFVGDRSKFGLINQIVQEPFFI